MKYLAPLLAFIFHLNFFGPLVMGVLDSSFLVLPFGNDLVVVGLVAQKRHDVWLYVVSAAIGSTLGALILALVAKRLGEERIRKMAGQRMFNRLCGWIDGHGALSIAAGALAPPPFPYTVIIAAAAALHYPVPRIVVVNLLARTARFTLLAWLALRFGSQVLAIAQSAPFRWTMIVFILVCLGATVLSLSKWLHTQRRTRQPAQSSLA